jgi:hypothetical protein
MLPINSGVEVAELPTIVSLSVRETIEWKGREQKAGHWLEKGETKTSLRK